ncbi:MAG: hypothetical protein KF873_07135 [Gemmataceae bacterium]|nr:hypothetical protein [Gemmataceae bacterium]
MKTLQEAREWYHAVRTRLLDMKQLAKKHWDHLPWGGDLGKEERFKNLEASDLMQSADLALSPIDDLAILVFFSVFEARVRDVLEKQVSSEVESLRHSSLKRAGQDLLDCIREGSFDLVMKPFKDRCPDLVEQVNQVRQYRNWVAHGRPENRKPKETVDPEKAYQRLTAFLAKVEVVID